MSMTELEIKQNAIKAQEPWGPYGIDFNDDVSQILYKLALQVEACMRAQKKVTEATQHFSELMDTFAKGLAAVEAGLENKSKLFTDSRGTVKLI
jgi:hypothetical protein